MRYENFYTFDGFKSLVIGVNRDKVLNGASSHKTQRQPILARSGVSSGKILTHGKDTTPNVFLLAPRKF